MTRAAVNRTAMGLCAALLLGTGCASPGRLLENSGEVRLVRSGESVRLSTDDLLVVHWTDGDVTRSTTDLAANGDTSGQIALVEANASFLHVSSRHWKRDTDLSRRVLGDGVRWVPRTGRYRRPTLLIPVDRVVAVELYELLPRLQRPRWSDVWRGMSVSAVGAMTGFAAQYPVDEPFVEDSSDILLGTALIGAIGGAVYPAYRLFPPRYADEPVRYDLRPEGQYRMEVTPAP